MERSECREMSADIQQGACTRGPWGKGCSAQQGHTILIVDDAPANIETLVQMLKDSYSLRVARDGWTALEMAKAGGVDLILLDVMMPKMSGFEVCQALKWDDATRGVPVILMTSLQESENHSLGFSTGAVDYLPKPFVPSIVESRIATQLELVRQRRRLDLTVAQQSRFREESRLEVLRQLCRAADLRDNDNALHLVRVSHYSYLIARAAGLPESTANAIRVVAPLHDVGKIGVPDQILLKEGAPTEEEWQVIRRHCQLGYSIIGEHGGESVELAALCAYCHHERWDGTGYPSALAGEEIPLVARVVAIADVFDVLTTKRPYREAYSAEEAVAQVKSGAGTHFDPALVHAFLCALPEILVLMERLDTGEDCASTSAQVAITLPATAGCSENATEPLPCRWLRSRCAAAAHRGRGVCAGGALPPSPPSLDQVLDYQLGVRQVGGSPDLYRDLLHRFQGQYSDTGRELGRMVEAGDREGASFLAHSVRGIAGIVAAGPLHKAARDLEGALKSQGCDCTAPLTAVQAQLELLLGALQHHGNPPGGNDLEEGLQEKRLSLAEEGVPLVTALRAGDPAAASACLQELLGKVRSSADSLQLAAIADLMGEYRYREAASVLESLSKKGAA